VRTADAGGVRQNPTGTHIDRRRSPRIEGRSAGLGNALGGYRWGGGQPSARRPIGKRGSNRERRRRAEGELRGLGGKEKEVQAGDEGTRRGGSCPLNGKRRSATQTGGRDGSARPRIAPPAFKNQRGGGREKDGARCRYRRNWERRRGSSVIRTGLSHKSLRGSVPPRLEETTPVRAADKAGSAPETGG